MSDIEAEAAPERTASAIDLTFEAAS